MAPSTTSSAIPVTRAAFVLRYVQQLESLGAPVDRLLSAAGIPMELLEHPDAAISLDSAFHFGELACQALGTEHLALNLGIQMSLDELGPYGKLIQRSVTVYEYLCKGISLYNMLITGQRFSLVRYGDEMLLNLTTAGEPGVGSYQSHIESMAISIANLKQALGSDWSPREISFAYRSREDLPENEFFSGSKILRGNGKTYITIPRALMIRAYPKNGAGLATEPESPAGRPLPDDLAGLVQLQIETLLSDGTLHIDTVAESFLMSRRSLQRCLKLQGTTYSRLLAETRTQLAARWLQSSDEPIADIAFELGYADASNFTRAFRHRTGVSPQLFRFDSAGEPGAIRH